MKRLELLREGKTKKVYATDDPTVALLEYKDDTTAFKGLKHGRIPGKGAASNRISNCLMQMLAHNGIATHFLEEIADNQSLVRRVDMIPLAVVVRNVAAGSLSQRLGLPQGTHMRRAILEFAYQNEELGDPLVNDYHIAAMGWATRAELQQMVASSLRINELLQAHLKDRGIELVDCRLQFGRDPGGALILADEISPDTCRLWDLETHEKMDKDRFREGLDGIAEAYQKVLLRLLGQ